MSLPYYGGMRHIHVIPGSVDQACGEIRSLSDAEIERVLDFVARLKAEREPVDERVGTPQALLEHVGKFSFDEGERQQLLSMALEVRQVGVR